MEFCSICPRKVSFVPEKFPENPRMAKEKYGMYACIQWNVAILVIYYLTHKQYKLYAHK